MKKYLTKTTGSDTYIDGVPILKWGEWKDNSFAGSIAMGMDILGKPVSYADVMGITGLCFRFTMSEDWCPGAPLAQHGPVIDDAGINGALGIKINWVADAIERDNTVRRNIDSGLPVMLLGQDGPPEWGLLTGYNRDGEYFGRSYFDIAHTENNFLFTENRYKKAIDYPGVFPEVFVRFFDRECEKFTDRQILFNSLQFCLNSFSGEFDKYKTGEKAYRIFIDGMQSEDDKYRKLCRNDQFFLGVLIDALNAAQVFLNNYLSVLAKQNQLKLQKVISLYKTMKDSILEIIPYEKTSSVFDQDSAPVWDKDIRTRLAGVLIKNCVLEKELRLIVKEILDNWDI